MNTEQGSIRAQSTFPIFIGLIYSLIFTISLTLVLSVLLFFTEIQEQSLPVYIYLIHGLSLFIGGVVTGKKSSKRGMYQGGILGIIYTAIVVLIAFLGFDAGMSLQTISLLLVTVIMGALGGILGVNTRR